MQELISGLDTMGIDTGEETFLSSIDHFGENNLTVYNWQENQYINRGQYGLLSLLDLGLIGINYDE